MLYCKARSIASKNCNITAENNTLPPKPCPFSDSSRTTFFFVTAYWLEFSEGKYGYAYLLKNEYNICYAEEHRASSAYAFTGADHIPNG